MVNLFRRNETPPTSSGRSTYTLQGPGPQRWKPAKFAESRKMPLVVFGDAMFGSKNSSNIKGYRVGIVNLVW